MTLIVESLPGDQIDVLIGQAQTGISELETARELLQCEKNRRRGLLLAATEIDTTGFVDALDGDLPVEPSARTDSVWTDWMEPRVKPEWSVI